MSRLFEDVFRDLPLSNADDSRLASVGAGMSGDIRENGFGCKSEVRRSGPFGIAGKLVRYTALLSGSAEKLPWRLLADSELLRGLLVRLPAVRQSDLVGFSIISTSGLAARKRLA